MTNKNKNKIYRCGYCGTPVGLDGQPLSIEDCQMITDEQLNNAELIQGLCCEEEVCGQDNYVTISKEMAMDAGDMSLEGQRIRW